MATDGKNSSVWSVEEDAELARLQEIHGNRWALVAAELPGKTGQQCAQRWRHKVNPAIKKEKWTPEEDAQLATLYEAHGQRWAEIARHLEGRTDQQCMGRWRRHLDPSVKKDAWTFAEDEKLTRLHDAVGPRWSNISKMLTGRTAQQCRARWFQLSAGEDEGSDFGSDFGGGASVVTVTVAAAGDSRIDGCGNSGKRLTVRASKSPSENISPSTPSVTEEAEANTSEMGGGGAAQAGGMASSKKRAGPRAVSAAEKSALKRRKTLKESSSSEDKTDGSPEYYGHGSGLDMLAMLYSAAVTYERGVAAVTGAVSSLPAELHA